MNELGKDKRPPESIIWDSPPEELDEWLDKIFAPKEKGENMIQLNINPKDIEG